MIPAASPSSYFIGLISGTSIDAVDCVLLQFDGDRPRLKGCQAQSIPPALKQTLLQLCSGKNIDLEVLGQTDIEIGRLFAATVNKLLAEQGVAAKDVAAIGSHGQTVYHLPDSDFPFSMQLGDANSIAQLTGITTVADFRRRDMAVGGQGAPLAPLLHQRCFSSPEVNRVILNLGGIANISILEQDKPCVAFDTGPASVLMDYWIDRHQNRAYDENGAWAASGKVDPELLSLLLQQNYFALPAPKSTGRELFNGSWLELKLTQLTQAPALQDVQATLLELTARTVCDAVNRESVAQELYACGGGAHNQALMARIAQLLPDCKVDNTTALGIHPDWVEAAAFAWMAKQTLAGKKIDSRSITGAKQATIFGAIYRTS